VDSPPGSRACPCLASTVLSPQRQSKFPTDIANPFLMRHGKIVPNVRKSVAGPFVSGNNFNSRLRFCGVFAKKTVILSPR
jgi:hypothetical protein